MTLPTWIGILVCLSQSAMFSGLNLGLFSLSRLELTVGARKGDARAQRVLALREDSNFALVTILWGNVGVNVLLALLSGSVLSGVAAFLFSTVVITLFAEIAPQSYFTRNALRMASLLAPVLKFYQLVLYPVAKPTALVLDWWLGDESVRYFKERDLRRIIQLHMEAEESEIARVEGQGALNFLELDDVPLREEGEPVDPASVLQLEFDDGLPRFPAVTSGVDDPLLQRINQSGKRWIVIIDGSRTPRLVLNSENFLREALFARHRFSPLRHCHRPILVHDGCRTLGELITRFRVRPEEVGEDILDDDIILLWGDDERRVVTSSDILGRLLRGIARPPQAVVGGGGAGPAALPAGCQSQL